MLEIKDYLKRVKSLLFREKKIVMIGDSHVRSYAFNDNFLPIFVGQGKLHNFLTDDNANRFLKGFTRAFRVINPQKVVLIIGEPDTRYCLGAGWLPWESANIHLMSDYRKVLDNSTARLYDRLSKLNLVNIEIMCLSIMPTLIEEQNKPINYMNYNLKDCFKKSFIDVYSKLDFSTSDLKNTLADNIHMSTAIQKNVETEMLKLGIISKARYSDSFHYYKASYIKSKFKYSDRFGCYVFK